MSDDCTMTGTETATTESFLAGTLTPSIAHSRQKVTRTSFTLQATLLPQSRLNCHAERRQQRRIRRFQSPLHHRRVQRGRTRHRASSVSPGESKPNREASSLQRRRELCSKINSRRRPRIIVGRQNIPSAPRNLQTQARKRRNSAPIALVQATSSEEISTGTNPEATNAEMSGVVLNTERRSETEAALAKELERLYLQQ